MSNPLANFKDNENLITIINNLCNNHRRLFLFRIFKSVMQNANCIYNCMFHPLKTLSFTDKTTFEQTSISFLRGPFLIVHFANENVVRSLFQISQRIIACICVLCLFIPWVTQNFHGSCHAMQEFRDSG